MKLSTTAWAHVLLILATGASGLAQGLSTESATPWTPVTRATFAISYPENELVSMTMIGIVPDSQVTGHAEGERRNGRTVVKLRLSRLRHPQDLGVNYTCYLIWAITPQGIVDHLGRLPVSKTGSAEIEISAPHRTFGLIVTAEPHPLVRYPGPGIVAENLLDRGTKGQATQRTIEYRGDSGVLYAGPDHSGSSPKPDYDTPLSVLGARRAVEIARRAGAAQEAAGELRSAHSRLAELERLWPRYLAGDNQSEEVIRAAGAVMQIAEAARARAVEHSEAARVQAETALARLELTKPRPTDRDGDRTAAYEAEVAQTLNRAEQGLTRVDRVQAREQLVQMEIDRRQWADKQPKCRAREHFRPLQDSISEILETRHDQRGLIVTIPDSLFDPRQSAIIAGAQEKLSNLARLLLTCPGAYRIEIEGLPCPAGTDAGQQLFKDRAASVRNYLLQAGLPENLIRTSQGPGQELERAHPAATDRISPGRGPDCRVEILIIRDE